MQVVVTSTTTEPTVQPTPSANPWSDPPATVSGTETSAPRGATPGTKMTWWIVTHTRSLQRWGVATRVVYPEEGDGRPGCGATGYTGAGLCRSHEGKFWIPVCLAKPEGSRGGGVGASTPRLGCPGT